MRYDFPMILPALSRMASARLLAVWDRLYSRWKAWLWGIETGGQLCFGAARGSGRGAEVKSNWAGMSSFPRGSLSIRWA